MANYSTVARPYAKALFDGAQEMQLLAPWSEVLNALSVIFREPNMLLLINNPKLSDENLLEIITRLCESTVNDGLKKLGDHFSHFIRLLIQKRRLITLPDIAELYHELLVEKENRLEVTVSSAFPLNDAQRQQLKQRLEKRFHKTIEATFVEEPTLMGGVMIQSHDWVIDGSVRNQLNELGTNLLMV